MISFIFFSFSLIFFHKNNLNFNFFLKKFKIDVLMYLIIFYVIIRLDILNSIHNFNVLFLKKNYITYFFLIMLTILINYLSKSYFYFLFFKNKKIMVAFFYLIRFSFFIFYVISLTFVVIYNIDVLEFNKNFKILYLYFYIIMYVYNSNFFFLLV